MPNSGNNTPSPKKKSNEGIPLMNGHNPDTSQHAEAGPSESDIATFMDVAQRLEQELCSIVVGQERVIRELLLALFAGGHVLLEGVPGLGKTLLIRTLSDALTLKFARIQFTPDLMPADIAGTTIGTEK